MTRLAILVIGSLLFLQPLTILAADQAAKKTSNLSKEERVKRADKMEKMAEMHKKMAECLRSDRPAAECREQMGEDWPTAKDWYCPMMDEMDDTGKMWGHSCCRGKKAIDHEHH